MACWIFVSAEILLPYNFETTGLTKNESYSANCIFCTQFQYRVEGAPAAIARHKVWPPLLRRVATFWVMLAQIWPLIKFEPKGPTCSAQQCCDVYGCHFAIVWSDFQVWKMVKIEQTAFNVLQHVTTTWPNASNMLRPTIDTIYMYVALNCCDRLGL